MKDIDSIESVLWEARELSRSDPKRSLDLAEQAEQLCERLGASSDQRAQVLRLQMQVAFELGHTVRSETAQEALNALLPTCSPEVQARCKNGLGWLAYLAGKLPRALTLTREALEELSLLGEQDGVLWARNNLAAIYCALGANDRAVALYLENRRQSQALGKRLLEGGSLLKLALRHNAQEDFSAALEASLASRDLLAGEGDAYANALVHAQAINALLGLERREEAEALCQELQALPQPLPMITGLVSFYTARVLRAGGSSGEAQEILARGLAALPKTAVEERLLLQEERVLVLEEQGELVAAARLLKKILEARQRLKLDHKLTPLLECGARLAEKRGRYKQAVAYHKQLWSAERARLTQQNENLRLLFTVELELEKAQREAEEMRRRNAALEEAAARDGMTGLYNHATFQRLLHEKAQEPSLAVVLFDVDNFKCYNDTFGHPAGDALLKNLAERLSGQVRADDLLARYGGEEFALLLPGQTLAQAEEVAERLRQSVEALGNVTISVGVAAMPPLATTPAALVEAADQALYQAKRLGRNQVVLHQK